MKLHPLFDDSGIDSKVMANVKAGRPLVALKKFKRAGTIYEAGQDVIIGDHKNDDMLCRPSPITGKPWVVTREYYEASKQDAEYKHYQRDVLAFVEQQHNAAKREVSDLQAYIAGQTARLEKSKNDLDAAKKNLSKAKRELDKTMANAPEPVY